MFEVYQGGQSSSGVRGGKNSRRRGQRGNRGQRGIMQGLEYHCKDYGFYSKGHGKQQQDVKGRCDMNRSRF